MGTSVNDLCQHELGFHYPHAEVGDIMNFPVTSFSEGQFRIMPWSTGSNATLVSMMIELTYNACGLIQLPFFVFCSVVFSESLWSSAPIFSS